MGYVPNINEYIKDTTVSRYDIIEKMLEHENPAFIFMSILKHVDLKTLKESINQINDFGQEFDSIILCDENANLLIEKMGTRNKFEGKKARADGRGALKELIGKRDRDDVSGPEWQEIGHIISNMTGWNKRDYVGMMNFLDRSCQLFKIIKKELTNNKRSIRGKQIYQQHQQANKQQLPANTQNVNQQQLPENKIFSFDEYSSVLEDSNKLQELSKLDMMDLIKVVMVLLDQSSDEDVASINNDIDCEESPEILCITSDNEDEFLNYR